MKATQLLAAATLAISSACAFATPQYIGPTTADFSSTATNNYSEFVNNGSGYYLWNEEGNESNWHLRWTSNGSNSGNNVNWAGSILFHNDKLDTYSKFSFENSQDTYSQLSIPGLEIASFTSLTNDSKGIDGVDFTLLAGSELMRFTLGSDLFNGLKEDLTDSGQPAQNIFIGETFAAPNVLISHEGGMTYQSFEVSVPEPGTLALLGLGLAGLGFARRKQA